MSVKGMNKTRKKFSQDYRYKNWDIDMEPSANRWRGNLGVVVIMVVVVVVVAAAAAVVMMMMMIIMVTINILRKNRDVTELSSRN
jgi:hypothetical protein